MAGDPNVNKSLGVGGGIVIFPSSGPAGILIDRNVIVGNMTDNLGGGVAIRYRLGSDAKVTFTNNVIKGNTAEFGGGVYLYRSESDIVNNTIVENIGRKGGGLYVGQGAPTKPQIVTNDIVVGNMLSEPFPVAGGLYSLAALDPNVQPDVSHNDLFGNEDDQVAGNVLNDANTIGFNGNFSADPLFIDPNMMDHSLAIGSPAIDTATAAVAPPVDHIGTPRGQEGDGTVDSPEVGDVDVGAFESLAFCQSSAELCDGIDNNCNALVDEGFPDTDGDTMPDCLDNDDDNDLALDAMDCAPLDGTAFGPPAEVLITDITGESPTTLTYAVQNIGSGTHYEVISGLMSPLPVFLNFQHDFCVDPNDTGGSFVDARPAPPVEDAWFWTIRAVNACGAGTLGSMLRDEPGAGDVCTNGVIDADNDGSRSDLDCDEGDPARSHLFAEICDGLDNDCTGTPDDGLGQTTCGRGACLTTVDNCVGGVPQVCTPGSPAPDDATCDGIDDNCDGINDEDWQCPFMSVSNPKGNPTFFVCTTTCGVGECADNTGVLSCTAGMEVDTCDPFAGASAEVCDGLDNNCNGVEDEGFLDTDGDSMADCVDPDDDNDGANDPMDYAPLDDTAFAVPTEVMDLDVLGTSPTQITWTNQNFGTGTLYDVGTGTLATPGSINFAVGSCLTTTAGTPAMDTRPNPAAMEAYYYLTKSKNNCGGGTYGSVQRDTLPACP